MPILRSSCTLCCVGFVFCSPTTSSDGASVTWTNATPSGPSSALICLRASRKGRLSMSPTVPPHSTTSMSRRSPAAIRRILAFISSVTWGMICTHAPRYLPRLSASITDE